MRGSSDETDNFGQGFVAGVVAVLVTLVLRRAIDWVSSTSVVDAAVTWATTPVTVEIAPIDFLGVLPGIMAIGLLFLALVVYPAVFRGGVT